MVQIASNLRDSPQTDSSSRASKKYATFIARGVRLAFQSQVMHERNHSTRRKRSRIEAYYITDYLRPTISMLRDFERLKA